MGKTNFYNLPDGGRFDATRQKLALFDAASLRDIIDLVQYRGSSLISDIHVKTSEMDPPRLLAVLSPDYVRYSDSQEVLLGLATVWMAGLRKTNMGLSDYQKILQTAYSLPAPLANYYAKKVETLDSVLVDADQSGTNEWTEYLSYLKNQADRVAAGVVNQAASLLGLGAYFNWDVNQNIDMDYLSEMASLGEAVCELARRSRLMTAQSMIQKNLGALMTGDVEGDPYTEDSLVIGDAIRAIGNRSVGKGVLGAWGDVERMGKNTSHQIIASKMKDAGARYSKESGLEMGEPRRGSEHLHDIISGLLNAAPNKLILLGLAGSLGIPAAIKLIKGISQRNQGDPSDLYGDVVDGYGEDVAASWQAGDIEGVVAKCLEQGSGDPLLTGDVSDDELEEIMNIHGDPDFNFSDPLVGDVFGRMRTNIAVKRAVKQANRMAANTDRFASKQAMKNARRAQKTAAKYGSMSASSIPQSARYVPQRENYVPAPEVPEYEEPSSDETFDDGNVDMGIESFEN